MLLDWQSRTSVADLLRQLGWDVKLSQETGLPGITPDYKLVEYAQADARLFFTFDHLTGEHGALVAKQLREYGGKVLKIRGGPDQSPYRAVGRILFYYPEWEPFLRSQSGLADISDTKHACWLYTPSEYLQKTFPTGAKQFEEYLGRQRKKRSDAGRRKSGVPIEQHHMPLDIAKPGS